MALSSALFSSQVSLSFKVDERARLCLCNINIISQRVGQRLMMNPSNGWSFLRGSMIIHTPNLGNNDHPSSSITLRKSSAVNASWMACSQIASGAFTLGTAAVLPFYALMVVAPQAQFVSLLIVLTKKVVSSSLPYMVLGALYGYLLYLSWTPDTLHYMFATKYLLPELSGMAKMFSTEMTLASAWIHLLTVDLFAARQVYGDGLQNNIETRHSISLCLLFCPIGILAHALTKALTTRTNEKTKMEFTDEEEAVISTDFIKIIK